MRRRYVQRDGKLIPKDEATARAPMVLPDIESFVSHVDGTPIRSRSDLREHNRRLGVVSVEETASEVAEKTREREAFYEGQPHDTEHRRDAAIFAHDLHSSGHTQADKQQMIENYRNQNDG